VQRRPAEFIFAEDQIRIAIEQRRDLANVASSSRIVNLAAEGETAPRQRDQRELRRSEEWGNKGRVG